VTIKITKHIKLTALQLSILILKTSVQLGSIPGRGSDIFSLPCSDWLWDPSKHPIPWVLWVLSLGVKRPGRETDP